MPKHMGASDSKINNDGVLTLKQACSGRYSGLLKLSSQRFEHAQNQSAPFFILFSITLEINGLGRYHAVINTKFGVITVYFCKLHTHICVPFLRDYHIIKCRHGTETSAAATLGTTTCSLSMHKVTTKQVETIQPNHIITAPEQ